MTQRATTTCILPKFVEQIRDIRGLSRMSTSERIKAFDDITGDGKGINFIYEKSRLLQRQETAFEKFIDNIDGVSLEKKVKVRDHIQEVVKGKKDKIKNEELLTIMEDIVERRNKISIPDKTIIVKNGVKTEVDTMEYVSKLTKEIEGLEALAKATADGSPQKLTWGDKVVELSDMFDGLKQIQHPKIRLAGTRIVNKWEESKFGGVGQAISELGAFVFNPAIKSVKASLDNSVLFRQGLKVLSANPEIWRKNANLTRKVWGEALKPDEVSKTFSAFKADLVTKDLYQDAIRAKLGVGVVEDWFPVSKVQKLPGFGRLFRTSDEAFTMFSQGSRMDLFESYVNLYKLDNAGKMPSSEIMKGFAKVANSTTGRGGLGSLESSAHQLNQVFFSARYQTANINTVKHAFSSTLPKEARAVAQKQLGRHLLMVGGVLSTFSMFMDVGLDWRESTFGKIRLPGSKKWIDVTGGLASYMAVIGKSWDKMTGDPKYKDTAMEVITGFMLGKLAPVPGTIRDVVAQRDYSGQVPTVFSATRGIFTPITLDNPIKDYQQDVEASVNALSTFLELGGFSVTQPKSGGEGSYPTLPEKFGL